MNDAVLNIEELPDKRVPRIEIQITNFLNWGEKLDLCFLCFWGMVKEIQIKEEAKQKAILEDIPF